MQTYNKFDTILSNNLVLVVRLREVPVHEKITPYWIKNSGVRMESLSSSS